jgi:pyruvate, water dikinase
MRHILWFKETGIHDVAQVGGKNASLGEMLRELTGLGIQVPDGFSVTADAYRIFLKYNKLEEPIKDLLDNLKRDDVNDLSECGRKIRNLIHNGKYPEDLEKEILESYHELSKRAGMPDAFVAVCSSATAEDLPNATLR